MASPGPIFSMGVGGGIKRLNTSLELHLKGWEGPGARLNLPYGFFTTDLQNDLIT